MSAEVEFREMALGELIDSIAMGPFGSDLKVDNFISSGVPVLRGGNLSGVAVDDTETPFVTQQKADSLARSKARPGDLVATHRGTIGQVSMVPRKSRFPEYLVSQSQLKITLKETRVVPEYLTYWFRSTQGQFQLLSYANQTGVPAIAQPTKSFKNMRVRLPGPSVQNAVVEVLGALDDKIAANRCLESNIDSLLGAQASSMWRTSEKVPLGELLRLHYGKALPVSQRAGGAAVVVGSGGIVGSHNEELVSGPAVIVGRKGTVGATYWIAGGSYPIDTTFWVEPTGAPLAYLYYLLKSIDFVSMSSDSAVPGLNRNRAYATEVPRVSASDLEAFESASSGLMRRLEASQSENRTLATTRDELLPLLMSGRISVKDAERRVEQEV